MRSIWQVIPLKHRVALACAITVLFIALLLPSNSGSTDTQPTTIMSQGGTLSIPIIVESAQAQPRQETSVTPTQVPAQIRSTPTPQPSAPSLIESEDIVRSGDTLSEIFERNQAGLANIYAVLANSEYKQVLSNLYPGQKLVFKKYQDGSLHSFQYWEDLLRIHQFEFGDDIRYQFRERAPNISRQQAHAVIESSLFLAGRDAGISENMTMDLAAIFGWDIDFILDIRQGDEFKVIWDEYEIDGTIIDTKIVAAQFINDGESFSAISFTDSNGRSSFYNPQGLSMRKAFIRTPVEFARISSPFNPNRRHPVLNTIRAHKGTDYAAPTGTPIKASGEGRVVFRGVKGGYGNTIIIQHGNNIRTLYAHMNGFARGIRTNDRVRQGQIIGYVGATGMVTGPHLHYEFLVNGVHRNPQTIDLPEARPIDQRYRADFDRLARPLVAQLSSINLLAQN